jgi:hypothetical protein
VSVLSLEPSQKTLLLAAKTAWLEGERSLDALAEKAAWEGIFAQIQTHLKGLRSSSPKAREEAKAQLLPLIRRLSPIPNPVLGRPSAQSLGALLGGDGPIENRLYHFLLTQPAKEQTTMHWLHAAFPETYPLPTPLVKMLLRPTRQQYKQARELIAEKITNQDAIVGIVASVIAEWIFYEAIKDALGVASYAEVNAILRVAQTLPEKTKSEKTKPKQSKKTSGKVREEAEGYNASTTLTYTDTDVIAYLEAFIAAKGFHFPPLAVASYYCALKAKPFAILAGLSGTGKTRLTTLLAEGLTEKTLTQYLLLPVRPDWTDPTPLLGYFNPLTGRYQRTVFIDFITEATRPENRHLAYFVCLDEMNLARVEHYFADLLSAMETEDQQLLLGENLRLAIPPNLFITGSVNVDEASHPFSRKVLDRANVLEFATVDFATPTQSAKKISLTTPPTIHERQRIFLAPPPPLGEAQVVAITATLTEINAILTPSGQHFGYRVRDEILRFMACASTIIPTDTALDLQLLQKILPRLSGVAESLLPALRALLAYTETRFPLTAHKITRMCQRAETMGFVTFFE